MKKSTIADLCLLFVAFIWGTTFLIVQNAISFLSPHSFNAIRFFMASVFLFLILYLFYRSQLQQITLKMLLSGVVLGICLFGGYAFQTIGLLYTTSSKAGFITGLSVVLVPVFALILLKQRPKWPAVLGVCAAAIGLYLLALGDTLVLNPGDFLIFLCAICFALQIIFTGKFAPNYPSMALALIQIFTVSILSTLSAFLFEDWRTSFQIQTIVTPAVMRGLLVTAIPATALAFLAQTTCQKFTTPTRVALIFSMEPVFAAIASFIWTDEVLGVKALSGCLLIFIGMIFAEMKPEYFKFPKKRVSPSEWSK